MNESEVSICVVGLGYVGLPLAVAFGRTDYPTYGYELSEKKVELLKKNIDPSEELTEKELTSTKIEYSADPSIIKKANIIIAAIPTPIDKGKVPDLSMVKAASKTIGENISEGAIVVFESTVYPGVTEDICVPILEEASGLKFGEGFTVGYSPERINPGDKEHTIERVTKIVSGSDEETLKILSEVYGTVITAGIYEAPCIKVAEAAKVIENIQRDLNIALINELSTIFHKVGIDTIEVLKAAETKWNFHRYRPGLVGGHCIGVDPYYLTYRAEQLGYHPQIILAGRRVNDEMPKRVTEYVLRGLSKAKHRISGSKVLILGVTFKENVADTRNSKTKDLIQELQSYDIEVHGYDPLVEDETIEKGFGVKPVNDLAQEGPYQAMVLCAPHEAIINDLDTILSHGETPVVFMDIKAMLKETLGANENVHYFSL